MPATQNLLSLIQTSSLQVPIAASLLELLPDAALLAHLDNQRILAANSAATALTAYNYRQLLRHTIPQLLQDFDLQRDLQPANAKQYFQRTLLAANGKRHLVRVTCHPIGENTPWVVLRIHKAIAHPQTTPVPPTQWENQFIESIERIIQLIETGPPQKALWEHLLRAIQPLTEARLLAFYQVSSTGPQARCIATLPAQTPLPMVLEAHTLAALSMPLLWHPGAPARTPLEGVADTNGWRYLSCVPLGTGHEMLGVLCAADPERRPSPRLQMALHTMSKVFTLLIHHNSVLKNVRYQNARLAEEVETYRLLAEHIPMGVLFLDADKRIQLLNPMAEALLGYQNDEVLGWMVEDVVIGADNFSQQIARAMQGEVIHSLGAKCELHHRNGYAFPANVQIIPTSQASQGPRLLVLIEDISQHEAMANQTRKLEQQARLGEVTSIFAHEVRNPINNIQMGLQLLSVSLSPDEATQDTLQRMQNDLQRLTELMDSVLAFSRSHVRKQHQPLDLRLLLSNLLGRWRARLARQKVQHRFDAPENLPPINGHAPSLEQVFNNLFSNALRAMPDGGTLVVRITPQISRKGKRSLRVDVADTGIGIPPEIQEQIFKPFFTTDQQKGTGLGLAITQQIITDHQGTIQVQSYPGGGTIFRIYLPVPEAPSSAPDTNEKETRS
ncbi:MAG: PAS domain S-box protein [Anaerolineae bacterium]|nr:MAG: PAS domain S-box protein [Anaerolineae bacterium]